jgi:hypothetical protein
MQDIFIFMVLGFLCVGFMLAVFFFQLCGLSGRLSILTDLLIKSNAATAELLNEQEKANHLQRQLLRSYGHEPVI